MRSMDILLEEKIISSTTPFNLKSCCLYRGEECKIDNDDKKNPSRWREAHLVSANDYLCKERNITIKYKGYLLEICERRNDDLAEKVRFRLNGIDSDLVAKDVRYHKICKTKFAFRVAVRT